MTTSFAYNYHEIYAFRPPPHVLHKILAALIVGLLVSVGTDLVTRRMMLPKIIKSPIVFQFGSGLQLGNNKE